MSLFAKNGESCERIGRQGTSSIEVIVAFTLLSTVLAVSTPLIVRHKRLVTAQRDYRLALDEASNQIERLSVLPRDQIVQAVANIQPSDFAAARLSAVKVSGRLEPANLARRHVVSVSWGDEQRAAAPITLTAWVWPEAEPRGSSAERRSSP